MLDPFTAVSVAGNIVQFVQFGCQLVARAHEIYKSKSGALRENLEVEKVVARLVETIEELEHDHPRASTDSIQKTSSERRLIEIAESCTMIARDILSRLEAVKVQEPRSVWNSLSRALKSAWTKDELNALTKRLKSYISELDTTILISIKRNLDLATFRASENFHRLSETAQRIVDLLLLNRSIFTAELSAQTTEIKGIIQDEQMQTRALILDLIQEKGISQATSSSYVHSNVAAETKTQWTNETERSIWRWLLDSLGFPSQQDRHDEIAQAYQATFEWVFGEPTKEPQYLPWTNFPEWLRFGSDIYWINGKAGSGKSTLMKYIFNDTRTPRMLSQWSKAMPLVVANFFFWNSGTREQRSQAGLLRSLLFQILQHQPSLTSLIFPEEFAMLQGISPSAMHQNPCQPWSLRRLQEALQRLLNLPDLSVRMCLFVDGLDEFEGKDECNDYIYLIALLRSLASSPAIKVCVSSRPLPIFEEAFRETSSLRLQDLTTGDIRHFVIGKMTNDSRIQQAAMHEPLQKLDFVREVSEKAQGVFLWVKLVVRSLLEGIGNLDSIADLRARLKLLPADLEDLYRHMMMRTEPLYLQRASEVFQLVRTARYMQDLKRKDGQRTTPVTVLQLALAIDEGSDVVAGTGSWATERLSLQCDRMRSRLYNWCGGLLEVPDFFWNRLDPTEPSASLRVKVTWEVAYLHRTARDFLETKETWNSILQYTANTAFEPFTSLLKSTVRLYKIVGPLVANPLGYGIFRKELLEPIVQALLYAQRAEAITGVAHFMLLDELDKTAGRHLASWTGHYLGHWSQFLDHGEVPFPNRNFQDLAISYDLCGYVLSTIDQDHRFFLEQVQQDRVLPDPGWLGKYFKQSVPMAASDDNPREINLWDAAGKGFRHYMKRREGTADPILDFQPYTLLDVAVRPSCYGSRMAGVLLEHGADPNGVSGYQRIWEHVLSRAQASQKGDAQGKKWLEIMILFLRYNVDPRGYNAAQRNVQNDTDSARELIMNIASDIGSEHLEEIAMLQKLIDSRLPRSKRRKIKVWTSEKFGARKLE